MLSFCRFHASTHAPNTIPLTTTLYFNTRYLKYTQMSCAENATEEKRSHAQVQQSHLFWHLNEPATICRRSSRFSWLPCSAGLPFSCQVRTARQSHLLSKTAFWSSSRSSVRIIYALARPICLLDCRALCRVWNLSQRPAAVNCIFRGRVSSGAIYSSGWALCDSLSWLIGQPAWRWQLTGKLCKRVTAS